MRDLQAEAAWFREGLRFGVSGTDDVALWAASALGVAGKLEDAMLELSFMRKAHVLDVISVLQSMSESIATLDVLPEVLGSAHEIVKAEPAYGRALAHSLYQLYCQSGYRVPDELDLMSWFDDAYSLAAEGVYGSLEDVQRKMEDFTGQFQNRANRFKPIEPPPLRSGEPAA